MISGLATDPLTRALYLSRLALAFGRVGRATFHPDGRRVETDTDHTVMLCLVAVELAPPGLDRLLVLAFAVVHDLPEVYAGDTQSLGISDAARAAKEARERAAYERLVEELGGESRIARLIAEYEAQELPEARYVRLVDKVLPKLTHADNGAIGAKAFTTRAGFVEAHARQYEKLAREYPAFPETLALLRAAMLHAEAAWKED